MSHLRWALLAMVLLACGDAPEQTEGEPAADTMAVPEWVDEVAAVANAIEARPGASDSILQANDMTREQLDSLLYEVAADPTLTQAYQAARGR